MLFSRTRFAPLVVLALGSSVIATGCKRGHEAEPQPDDPPALAKNESQQGDATKTGRLQKPAPVAAEPTSKPIDDGPAPDGDDKAPKDVDDGDDAKSDDGSTSKHHGSSAKSEASDGDDKPASKLSVKRIQFSEEIAKREPVSAEETFSAAQTQKLYAFVEIDNPDKKRSRVIVTFIPPMGAPSKVELRVGDKSRWRTWALRRSVKAVGTWTVVVSDPKGNEIGKRSFEVTE